MEKRLKLSHDSTTEEVGATQYQRLVGSLRYLAHTRPDLAFSVGYVSRFMQRPTMEHQQAVKRIVRYVAGSLDHGLYYPRCHGEAHLVRYNDSDHVDDIDTSKSTSGILFFDKCPVSGILFFFNTSLQICSPSPLGGSSSVSFVPRSGWSNSPTRQRTRLRG
jgi:hypothetical protein